MNRYEVRNFIQEHGVAGFQACFGKLLEGHTLPNGVKVRLSPQQSSLKELWEGCVGSVAETFDNAVWKSRISEAGGALDPTGFPTATEKLLSSVTIAAYENARGVADTLVPQSMSPNTLTERIVGFLMPEGPKIIGPNEPYPTIGFGEKYVDFEKALHNKKEGFQLNITGETIRFDQTNAILDIAQGAGMTLATERERRTIRAVLGIGLDTGTAYNNVYFPSGVDTALYRASESNLRSGTDVPTTIHDHPGKAVDTKLEDYTDFQEVLTIHAQKIKDDRLLGTGRPIIWNPDTILVPVSLAAIGANILNATMVTAMANIGTSTIPEIRMNVANPVPQLFNGRVPTLVFSPYVDEVSSTAWVVYDRTRTFRRVNIMPFGVFRAPTGYGWDRDVVFSMRVREWSRCIALDFRTSIRSDGV